MPRRLLEGFLRHLPDILVRVSHGYAGKVCRNEHAFGVWSEPIDHTLAHQRRFMGKQAQEYRNRP